MGFQRPQAEIEMIEIEVGPMCPAPEKNILMLVSLFFTFRTPKIKTHNTTKESLWCPIFEDLSMDSLVDKFKQEIATLASFT